MENAPRPVTDFPQDSIAFDDWRLAIEGAENVARLLRVVHLYLEAWPADRRALLPYGLGAAEIPDADALAERAHLATQIRRQFFGTTEQYLLLRDMSLTLAAALARLRQLKSAPRSAQPA